MSRWGILKLTALNVILAVIIATTGCSSLDGKAGQQGDSTKKAVAESTRAIGYADIKPEDAKKRLDSEKDIILLDVRTLEEYTEKHIPGSLLIPVDEIEKKAGSMLKDKNAPIFVYCRSGNRSVTASKALVSMGYTKVYNLGGIISWPYATEAGAP